VARENAERNGVAARIQLPPSPLRALLETFDLVLANITAETLTDLADALAGRVAPGGRLIASGILSDESSRVTAALVPTGLQLIDSDDEEEWRALTFVRPG